VKERKCCGQTACPERIKGAVRTVFWAWPKSLERSDLECHGRSTYFRKYPCSAISGLEVSSGMRMRCRVRANSKQGITCDRVPLTAKNNGSFLLMRQDAFKALGKWITFFTAGTLRWPDASGRGARDFHASGLARPWRLSKLAELELYIAPGYGDECRLIDTLRDIECSDCLRFQSR
jgi:hypothetical protein